MAAGIVASTLRRRTFRHKSTAEAKYMAMEPGHMVQLSPTGSHPPSRSPSIRASLSRSPSGAGGVPKGTKLLFKDFWPKCCNPAEQNLKLVEFESFDTLIPIANAWLSDNTEIHLVKCETVERKICSPDEVLSNSPMFVPKGNYAIYLKGLRLWYIRERGEGSRQSLQANIVPIEIGYMNVIPKCLDSSCKYPIYENLPETYAAINDYLLESPLEGKILTIETVSLKLPRRHWSGPEVDPDQTYFPDEYLRHVLYITRIYFIYGNPEEELIGLANRASTGFRHDRFNWFVKSKGLVTYGCHDFLPDFMAAPKWYSIYGIYPKYMGLVSAMRKAKIWIQHAKNVRVANIQTLEAVYRGNPDLVETGVNFVDKIESCAMVRFLRVTYVYPQESSPDHECSGIYRPPKGFSYKTFIPCAVKVGMCSGAPQYEGFKNTWERARVWLKIADRNVIGAETFYHPVGRVWHRQDSGETTVTHGEWTTSHRGERKHQSRRTLVHVVRVYLDGDYMEPPINYLPPTPRVEEYNDCHCTIL